MLSGWCNPFPRSESKKLCVSESSAGRRTVSQDDGNSSWPAILAGHWVAPTVSHVLVTVAHESHLEDSGWELGPVVGLRVWSSAWRRSMQRTLVLFFRTPKGCHKQRDRAPCCGPGKEGRTHGRHRFRCSQWASKALLLSSHQGRSTLAEHQYHTAAF